MAEGSSGSLSELNDSLSPAATMNGSSTTDNTGLTDSNGQLGFTLSPPRSDAVGLGQRLGHNTATLGLHQAASKLVLRNPLLESVGDPSSLGATAGGAYALSDTSMSQISAPQHRLHRQLNGTGAGGTKRVTLNPLDSNILDMAKKELVLVNQERDTLQEMVEQLKMDNAALHTDLKTKCLELERSEAEHLKTKGLLAVLQKDTEKLLIMQEQNTKMLTHADNQLQPQIEKLADELSCCRTELKAAQSTASEKQDYAEQLKAALRQSEISCQQQKGDLQRANRQTTESKRRMTDKTQRFNQAQQLLLLAEEDIAALNQKISQLRKSRDKHIEKELDAVKQARECMNTAEVAMLSKEEAMQREKQIRSDNDRLQAEKTKLMEEMADHVKQQVMAANIELQTRITELMEEVSSLQQETCGKQASLEKLSREQQSLEKELEKARKRPEPLISEHTLAELRLRVNGAELARDEAKLEASQLADKVKQLEESAAHDTSQMSRHAGELRHQLQLVDAENEKLQDIVMSLSSEKDKLQQHLRAAEANCKATEDECALKLAAAQNDLAIQGQDSVVQLRNAEDRQHQALAELRSHVTAQQRLASKWRVESQHLSEKLDKASKEARDYGQKVKLQKRQHELELQQAKAHMAKNERRTHSLAVQCEQLSEELTAAHQSADANASQVEALLSRERALLEEKRKLQTDVYRLQLEVERLMSRHPGGMAAVFSSTMRPSASVREHIHLPAQPPVAGLRPSSTAAPLVVDGRGTLRFGHAVRSDGQSRSSKSGTKAHPSGAERQYSTAMAHRGVRQADIAGGGYSDGEQSHHTSTSSELLEVEALH